MQNSLIISAVIAVIAVAIPVFLGSSRRRRDTDSSVNSSGEPGETDQIVEAARKLQEAYWSLDSDAPSQSKPSHGKSVSGYCT